MTTPAAWKSTCDIFMSSTVVSFCTRLNLLLMSVLMMSSIGKSAFAQEESPHSQAQDVPASAVPVSGQDAPLPKSEPVVAPTAIAVNLEATPAQSAPSASEPVDELKLDVGGGMILFYNQPLTGPGKGFFEVFEARVRIDAEFRMFGIHIVPIARDTKERAFFPGTAWVQEAYAFAKLGPVTVKAGKVFAQFGRFWDNSFYGNVQEYDGFKLDPNNGISFEGNLGAQQRIGLVFFAQYFITDGTTNYSLPGRDTVSIPNARRRNYLVGRVEPFIQLGSSATLKLGVSGGYFQADLPTIGAQDVQRFAVDGTVALDALTVWAEYTRQLGRHVVDFPIAPVTDAAGAVTVPGRSADRAHYLLIGGEYSLGPFTARYNYSWGSYNVGVSEGRHVPGIAVALDKRLIVMLEWALERRYSGRSSTLLGSSLNLTIHGKV